MKTRLKLPSMKLLCECFLYERDTGKLFWKARPLKHFGSIRSQRRWNTRYAGKEAFTTANIHGYKTGAVYKRLYLAHRIIWKLVTSREPVLLDHIDRDTGNNRFENLRQATNGQNQLNRRGAENRGVHLMASGKWLASVQKDRQYFLVGTFETFEKAKAARRAKMRELFGEFAA